MTREKDHSLLIMSQKMNKNLIANESLFSMFPSQRS